MRSGPTQAGTTSADVAFRAMLSGMADGMEIEIVYQRRGSD